MYPTLYVMWFDLRSDDVCCFVCQNEVLPQACISRHVFLRGLQVLPKAVYLSTPLAVVTVLVHHGRMRIIANHPSLFFGCRTCFLVLFL